MSKGKLFTAVVWAALWSILLGGHGLASTWTLHWDWRTPPGPWKGEAQITVPEGDGPVTGAGTWENHTYTPQVNLFTRGRLIIRGRVENNILTFTPQFIIQERMIGGQQAPIPNPDPGLYGPSDTESIRVEDGAETRSISYGVPWVWRLSGEKKERWRITVDGWNRLARGGKPQPIPRPKELGKPSPWTWGTGKSAQEKYSDVLFGLLVHWRMIVDVEIEKGKYKKGTGRASMVSDTPFCQPSGVYHCQSRRTHVSNSPFTVSSGVKSGQQLNLTLFSRKYLSQAVVLSVSYECQLDKLAAEMTIVGWKGKNLPNQRRATETVSLPDRISVLLVDNWSRPEGQKGQPHSRFYKVKRLR